MEPANEAPVQAEPAQEVEVAEKNAEDAPAPAVPTDEEIVKRLQALLDTADLETTTERKLRQQLEKEFGVELKEKKQLIHQEVEAWLAKAQGDEEDGSEDGSEEEEEEEVAKKAKGSSFGSVLSPQMAAFLGVESMPRTQVVKKLWEYIKANNLQDPKNKQKIRLDEKLSTIFTPPLNMLNMNKQLSKHCKTSDAGSSGAGERKRAAPKPKEPAAKRQKEGGAGSGSASTSGFNKPLKITPALAEIFGGASELSRPQMTKLFHEYINKHNLKDPADKRYVLADEKLRALFGESRFQTFSLQKLIKPHLL